MIGFDTFTKIAKEWGRFGQINCCQIALKTCPKSNKSSNLVTLFEPYVSHFHSTKKQKQQSCPRLVVMGDDSY